MRRLHPPLGHDEACGLSTVDCHCWAPRCRNSKWRVLLRLQENDGNCSEKNKKKGSTIKRQLHSITCPEQNSPNTLQPLKHQPTNLNVQETTRKKKRKKKTANQASQSITDLHLYNNNNQVCHLNLDIFYVFPSFGLVAEAVTQFK